MREWRQWGRAGLIGLLGLRLLVACAADEPMRGEPFSLGDDGGTGGLDDGAGTLGGLDGGSTFGDETTGGLPPVGGDSTSGGAMAEDTGVVDDCPRVQVDVGVGSTLNVRPTPSTAQAPVGSLPHGAVVDVLGEEIGENIDGVDLWYHVANAQLEGYIFSTFAVCTMDDPPQVGDPNGFYLPLVCGSTVTVSQGNFGGTSHQGTSAYAFDFAIPLGTQLVAIADGTVTHVYGGTMPGDPCYNGGDSTCSGDANYVTLLHGDGTKSIYLHLSEPQVGVGDVVLRGEPVGLSGSTGWSTGRHAHVARMEDCGASFCQSIPLSFEDVPGDGVPVSSDMVTSANCP